MITLPAASTLGGKASTAGVVTYSIFGDDVDNAGVNSFTKLGQGQLTTSAASLVTAAALHQNLIKSVHIVNTDSSPRTVTLYVDGSDAAHTIFPTISIPASGMAIYNDDGWRLYDSLGNLQQSGGLSIGGATPSQIDVGDAAVVGSSVSVSHEDHQHALTAPSAPAAVTPDASAAAGSSANVTRQDHQHGIATYASTPVATDATAGAAGTSGTAPSRGDHRHLGHDRSHDHSQVGDGQSLAVAGLFGLTGVTTPAQITADVNDYAPGGMGSATVARISTDASRNITGLAGGSSGRLILIANIGAFDAVLKDESASSGASNRFTFDADLTLQPDTSCILRYDTTSSRWRLWGVGKAAGGGAAAGSTPSQIDIGDAQTGGSDTTYSKNDHQHAFPAPAGGYPVDTDFAAESDGSATTPARSDHKHTLATPSAPVAITPDGSAATGSSNNPTRQDHQHGIATYASTPVATDATAGAAGTSGTAPARGDHRHLGHAQAHDHSASGDGQTLNPIALQVSGGPLAFQGDISPAQITADQNDYNPTGLATAVVLRLDTDASHNLTGLAGGADGRILKLVNISANNILLPHESASSSASNRFNFGSNQSWTLRSGDAMKLIYDSTTSRWRGATYIPTSTAGPDGNVTVDTAGAAGTTSTYARAGHGHQIASYASAAAAIGTAAAGTSGTAPSRGDHVHPTGAGTPSTQAFGDAAATGSGPAAAMTDHKHAMPTGTAGPDANVTVDVAGAAGTLNTAARAGHGHQLVTYASTPAAVSTSGSAGVSGTAPARGDHVHAHETAHTAHDTIWDAAGDYVRGSGADTAVRQAASAATPAPVGTAGAVGTPGNPPSADDHVHAHDTQTTDLHTNYVIEFPVTFSKGGVLTTQTGAHRHYFKGAWTITQVRASVGTASSGASVIVDVNKNGTTIFTTQSNRPTIAAAGNTDLADAINVASLADGDYITMDIDQIGSGTAGSDLTVQIWVKR